MDTMEFRAFPTYAGLKAFYDWNIGEALTRIGGWSMAMAL